jgi:hypothetical protein
LLDPELHVRYFFEGASSAFPCDGFLWLGHRSAPL